MGDKEKKKSVLSRLFGYAGKHKYLSMIGMGLTGISSITAVLPIYYIWKVAVEVINVYPNFNESQLIGKYAWLAVIWACATMIIYLVGLLLAHVAAFRIARNLREKSLEHMMTLPLGFFNETGSGKLVQVINECAAATETFLAHNLPDLAAAVVAPVAIFGIMFAFDWKLGIVSIVPIILSILAMASIYTSKGMSGKYEEKLKTQEEMNNQAIEYVRGIPVLKTFGQTIYSFKKFHTAIENHHKVVCAVSTNGKKPMVGFEVLINSASVFLAIAGIVFISTESVMIEFLRLFLFGLFLMPLCTSVFYRIMFSGYNSLLSENCLNRVDELLAENTLKYKEKAIVPKTFDIEFENVEFSYPNTDKLAVKNTSLTIPQGKTYGFVGPSGGGKTTLLTLIPRFFDVKSGAVKIGGVDVRDISKEVLMDNISFVFQHTKLYKMSILDNVRESKPDATEEEVIKALTAARCMEFVNELPNGVHTIYGTKGTYLSGGQAQRIAIARAILKDAPIILLDEATSFTDPENEYEIKKAFDELTKGKTVLVIAHRLSTVKDSDKICYISDGEIKEQGNHEELMKKESLYADLYNEYQTAFVWNKEKEVTL